MAVVFVESQAGSDLVPGGAERAAVDVLREKIPPDELHG